MILGLDDQGLYEENQVNAIFMSNFSTKYETYLNRCVWNEGVSSLWKKKVRNQPDPPIWSYSKVNHDFDWLTIQSELLRSISTS